MGEQEEHTRREHEPSHREGMNHRNVFEASEQERIMRLHTYWQLSSDPEKLAQLIVIDTTSEPVEGFRTPSRIIKRQIDRILEDPNNRELSVREDDSDGLKLQAVIDALEGDDERQIRAALVVLRDLHVVTLKHGDIDSKLWIDLSRKLLVNFEIVDLDSEM